MDVEIYNVCGVSGSSPKLGFGKMGIMQLGGANGVLEDRFDLKDIYYVITLTPVEV